VPEPCSILFDRTPTYDGQSPGIVQRGSKNEPLRLTAHIVRMPELFCTIFCTSSLHQHKVCSSSGRPWTVSVFPSFCALLLSILFANYPLQTSGVGRILVWGGRIEAPRGPGAGREQGRSQTQRVRSRSEYGTGGEFSGRVCRHLALPADTPTDSEHAKCGGVNVVSTPLQCFAFPTKPCSAPFWST